MKVGLLGTRGVPARYGGFETAAEEIGARLASAGHDVIVYSRGRPGGQQWYRGMRVVSCRGINRASLDTVSHTMRAAGHAIVRTRPDVVVLFNAANAPLIAPLQSSGIPVVLHLDGLESQRGKWRGVPVTYSRWAERYGLLKAAATVADSRAMQAILKARHGRETVYISYGADLVTPPPERVESLGLLTGHYALVVARLEPENHVHTILEGYRRIPDDRPLVVVGGARFPSGYAAQLDALARRDSRVRMLGPVWDQDLLDALYFHAACYLHGHSVGGTNPSLLRAMGAGTPVIAHDNVFTREVTAGHALFFRDSSSLTEALEALLRDRDAAKSRAVRARERVASHYQWDAVAEAYAGLLTQVIRHRAL